MTGRLLDEGTSRHSSEEFADLLERNGIALGSGVSDGRLSVELDVPKRFLPVALDLLHQALADPVFPEAEVRRILKSRLAEIEQERASSPHRAARELIATLFDPADRASRPTAGSADSIGAITRDDIVAQHAGTVGPQGATVVVAGDLAGVDVPALAEQALGGWDAPGHVPPAPRRAGDRGRPVPDRRRRPSRLGPVRALGGRPGSRPARRRGWAPYPVLAFLLGGSPGARVDAVLREEKGFTYGMRSAFRPRVRGGTFLTSGSVRADVTGESLRLLLGILDGARDGFTEEEARSGMDFLAKTAPGRYATADAVADEAAALAVEGLGLTSRPRPFDATRRLTAADLGAAYRLVVEPGAWTVIVVGDAARIPDDRAPHSPGGATVVPA